MLTEQETRLTSWFADHEDEMHALTERLVNIDSGSKNKSGVDEVATALQEFFAAHNVACERLPVDTHGDAIRATVNAEAGGPAILLMGHRDTAFPQGEPKRRPYTVKEGRAYGPGVADMKSGLVQNAFILAAFAELGGAPAPLVFLCTGDEEIGTPSSKPIIKEQAKSVAVAFNAEPGRANGNVVTGRRGGVFFDCEVFGKAAHAGLAFHEGHSAIVEIASKIARWTALNETFADRDITLNVGLISGGQSVNTVAPHATCGIDLRYGDPRDRIDLIKAIEEITADCTVEGTRAEIAISGEFMPMKPSKESQALFEHYQKTAKELGIELDGEYARASADSGLVASAGVPVVCAVGPVGGRPHSPNEYMELATVVPRAQAVALSISRLTLAS